MPWFLFTLFGCALLLSLWRVRQQRRSLSWGIRATAAVCLFGLAIVSWPGRMYAERMLTEAALPLGAVWLCLLLTALTLAVYRSWLLAAWLGVLVAGLAIVGNGSFAGSVTRSLEGPYIGVDPLGQGSFDVVCLLGGGATIDVNRHVRTGISGDRIVVAARLYHAGRTPVVLCTGGDLQGAPNLPNVAEESASVLADLEVPDEAILLGPGYNTKTEIKEISALKKANGWKRIGIVTSAWHLPRVERLAKTVDLEFVPLPADFRSNAKADLTFWERFRRFSLIPKTSNLDESQMMLREKLAAVVGR